MSQIASAIYDDGVLKLEERIDLAPGAKVRVILDLWSDVYMESEDAFRQLDELCQKSPIDANGARLTRDQLHERR